MFVVLTQDSVLLLLIAALRSRSNCNAPTRTDPNISQNAQLLRKCAMLEKNLSCLYKTAWAHVRRKDDYIETLKGQIKDFRRLTGMVAPGVPLDGDSADAMDAVEDPAVGSKCGTTAK